MPPSEPPNVDALLAPGSEIVTILTGRARVRHRSMGHVDLPDGRVFACDPLVPIDLRAFAQRVDPGAYEAFLILAERDSAADSEIGLDTERILAAALYFSDRAVLRWERARHEDDGEESGAYGVDSGTGCFMGCLAARLLRDPNAVDAFAPILAQAERETDGVVRLSEGATVAVFTSGAGDGIYDSWWGYSTDGAPAVVLTDFGLLCTQQEADEAHARWARRAARKWWQFWR
jgi:hypothetical protein